MEDLELGLLSDDATYWMDGNDEIIPPSLMSLVWSIVLTRVNTLSDLKNVRLVSHLWRDVTLSHWRNTAVLRLLWRQDSKSFCYGCHCSIKQVDYARRDTLDLATYLELVRNSRAAGDWCPYQLARKQFTRFRIGYCDLLPGGDDDILERFWEECGQQVEFLYLDHCSVPDTRFGVGLRGILSARWGNLKELWVHLIPTRMDEVSGGLLRDEDREQVRNAEEVVAIPRLETVKLSICKKRGLGNLVQFCPVDWQWMALLQRAPNLKHLTVNSDRKGYHAVAALKFPACNGQFLQLAKLTFLVKSKYSSISSHDIPGWADYLEVKGAPVPAVEIGVEEANRDLNYFRGTVIELVRYLFSFPCNLTCCLTTIWEIILILIVVNLFIGAVLCDGKNWYLQ